MYVGENKDWMSFIYSSALKWSQHVRFWLGPHRPHNASVLVVKYEKLLTDLRTELVRIMKYLDYPYTEDDLQCTINSNTLAFRRNHSVYVEHYTQSEVDMMYKQIKLANKLLKNHNISYKKHVVQA